MDLVCCTHEEADRVLAASGFHRHGRYWSLSDIDLLVGKNIGQV
jgi:hypothetical protein